MTKYQLESTHNLIWRISYALSCLAFGAWFMYAANNYLKMSASSSVSLKNGDDGDRFVKFPLMSFCKSVSIGISGIASGWSGVGPFDFFYL